MKFIHIADVHLGAVPDMGFPWSEDRKNEVWNSFKSIIQRAEAEQIDLLLIAGDLFHRQPLMRELKEVNYLFSTLTKTRVVFIVGNHDYLKPDSYYRGFVWNGNVICLADQECQRIHFPDLGTTIYGFSYHEREITEALYDELVPQKQGMCTILLAHGGDERHIPISKKQLSRAGFDYVALGHIHKPQILEENRMAYAGALEPLDKNDTGKHGFITGEYLGGNMRTGFVPFAVREYIHMELEINEEDTDFALNERIRMRIAERGGQHIYKISLTGYHDPDISFDTKKYSCLGNIIEIQNDTKPAYQMEKLALRYPEHLVGRFIQQLSREDATETETKALYYGVQALLETTR